MSSETLICDTSFVANLMRREIRPGRYLHWGDAVLDRVEGASLAISIVTVAELRAGYVSAGWGRRTVTNSERMVAGFVRVPIEDSHLNEWARLWVAARARGIAISHNDLWIVATASVHSQVLVTCDRDHVRIASELSAEVLYLQPPV
ncbi:MAG TPA: PIN domain-containing protein [Solirubrobacterales bacterium]